MRWIWLKRASKYLYVESSQKGPLIYAVNVNEKGLQIFMCRIWPKRAYDLLRRIWPKRVSGQCVESDWKGPPNIIMRWIWLKSASKYLCVESDQKGPLIYALNLTEKGLQIFMRRIWPKRASDLSVESDWKRPPSIIMRRIWPNRVSDLCVESDWKGPPNKYS